MMIFSFLGRTDLSVSPLLVPSLLVISLFAVSPVSAQEVRSVEPLVGTCIDSDGDGFGWNGLATCDPSIAENILNPAPCIDTDGDGFGFDGISSCRVDGAPVPTPTPTIALNPSVGLCIDSDGDGFGWDGLATCLVDNAANSTVAACVDTDGDGYGWNGFETCLNINFVQPVNDPDVNGDGIADVFQTTVATADTNGNTIFDFFEVSIDIVVFVDIELSFGESAAGESVTAALAMATDINNNNVDDSYEAVLTGGADENNDGFDDFVASEVAVYLGVPPSAINMNLTAADYSHLVR